MRMQGLLFWVAILCVFGFSPASVMAGEGSSTTSAESRNSGGNLEDGSSNGTDGDAAYRTGRLSMSAVDGSAVSEGASTAAHRARNADYTLGYHLEVDDVVDDHVAGGFNIASRSLTGTQWAAGFNVAGDAVRGGQIAPVFNVTGEDLAGMQLAGGFNRAGGTLKGLQLAGGLNSNRGPVTGMQLAGALNLAAGDVQGVQLAAINIATGPVQGMQLGVFNVAPSASVGIGLFNIYWDGELEAELYGSDDDLMMVGIRHGGTRVYNVYHIGTRQTGEPDLPLAYGMGLGWRIGFDRSAEFSVDATATSILGGMRSWSWKEQVNLFKLRPMVTLRAADALALFGGPTVTVMVNARPTDAGDYARFKTWQLATVEDGAEVAIWPGFTFGVRLF